MQYPYTMDLALRIQISTQGTYYYGLVGYHVILGERVSYMYF